MNSVDTDQLRKLLKNATPPPWEVKPLVAYQRDTAGDIGRVGERDSLFTGEASYEGNHGLSASDENKELVVALVNAAPSLLDEIERVRLLPVIQDCRDCGWYRHANSCEWCAHPTDPAEWAHGGQPPPDECPFRSRS